MNSKDFMNKSDLKIIKTLITNINKNINENIISSESDFINKAYKSSSLLKLEFEFINIMEKLEKLFRTSHNAEKIQLISNYNTISTILDRLSVEKTKYYHFKNNMKKKLSPKEIKQKCILQKKIINEINIILEEKFIESFQCRVIILKEERTFK